MEILVAVLIIALIAAVIFAVMQRRPGGARGLGRPHSPPIGRRERGAPRNDPMAAAVAEHAQATDPHDAAVAEERLQAQAREVAAGLNAEAHRSEHQRAADQLAHGRSSAGEPRMDGGVDPATDPRYDDPGYDDPGYDDPGYDDRPPRDRVDPRHDDRPTRDPVDPRHDDRRR